MSIRLFLFSCLLSVSFSKFSDGLQDDEKEVAKRGSTLTYEDDPDCDIPWFKRVPCKAGDEGGSMCGFKCRSEDCCTDEKNDESPQCYEKGQQNNPCHKERKSSCYVGVPEAKSWTDAQRNCVEKGGHLVDIHDAEENNIVFEIAQGLGTHVYIDGNDQLEEGTWLWTSTYGKFYYDNWRDGEPNGYTNANCAVLLFNSDDGKWNDVSCNDAHASVCELKVKPPCHHVLDRSCYVIVSEEQTWEDAVNNCRTINGHLVEISSTEEDDLVQQVAKDLNKNVYIGATDSASEGAWRWENTNGLVDSGNWHSGKPYNDGKDCAYMRKESDGTWEDGPCSSTLPSLCEIADINECRIDNTCVHGTCRNTRGGYTCSCYNGWYGDACDTDVDECNDNSKCLHGTCSNTQGSYTCTCDNGWHGAKCDNDRNECADGTHVCEHGECVNADGGYTCSCHPGWNGDMCDNDIDECTDDSNCVHGTCRNTPGSYTCTCQGGWQGVKCNNDINECHDDSNCVQGTCRNSRGSYNCACESGWHGRKCDNDRNECADGTHVCEHGDCVNTHGSYKCSCHEGWRGEMCDNDINECSQAGKCVHGSCRNRPGRYDCLCNIGWTGRACNKDINECQDKSKCVHGSCKNKQGGYNCTCEDGWHGDECDNDYNECADGSHACMHGSCDNIDGSYRCSCHSGYEGDLCDTDINECTDGSNCVHGTCSNTPGGYNCRCEGGWQGAKCNNDINECNQAGMCVQGSCTNRQGSYTCSCNTGWFGDKCDQSHFYQIVARTGHGLFDAGRGAAQVAFFDAGIRLLCGPKQLTSRSLGRGGVDTTNIRCNTSLGSTRMVRTEVTGSNWRVNTVEIKDMRGNRIRVLRCRCAPMFAKRCTCV